MRSCPSTGCHSQLTSRRSETNFNNNGNFAADEDVRVVDDEADCEDDEDEGEVLVAAGEAFATNRNLLSVSVSGVGSGGRCDGPAADSAVRYRKTWI